MLEHYHMLCNYHLRRDARDDGKKKDRNYFDDDKDRRDRDRDRRDHHRERDRDDKRDDRFILFQLIHSNSIIEFFYYGELFFLNIEKVFYW